MRRLLFAMIALVAACAQPAPPPATDAVQDHVAQLWTAETRTVLEGEQAHALAHQCSRVSPGPVESVWTPAPAQLDALESELILLLSRQLEAAGESPSPGDYYRQYAGFVIGGRQVIYINGIAEDAVVSEPNPDHPFDWRSQAIGICDGGTITFGVEYDVATRRFSNFAFNGAI
jgi:hypothetical protein